MILAVQNYQNWRAQASQALRAGIAPAEVRWIEAGDTQQFLFDQPGSSVTAIGAAPVLIPRTFLRLAEAVARHADGTRWATLYRVAWRLTHGERHLLDNAIDDDVSTLDAMRRAVDKDVYQMRQFVRFRRVKTEGERYIAWYEPSHHTLDANGAFFADRFASLHWTILTPLASMTWDGETLEHGPGVPRSSAPTEDELEDLWRTYYKTIFNPARLKLNAMRAQLPVKRWSNLPESRTIPQLVREARARVDDMAAAQPVSASQFIPPQATLDTLRTAVRQCGACDLCRQASGPVFGEGNPQARVMLIGEQPGDEEDRAGRPFVGPAGRILDRALNDAGVSRNKLYITNAVKAFKFEERGKRRLHRNPRASDIATCKPWLQAEIDRVQPELLVCLGASAAQAVLGRKVSIAAERGKVIHVGPRQLMVTYHPSTILRASAILRAPDPSIQRDYYGALVADLKAANWQEKQ